VDQVSDSLSISLEFEPHQTPPFITFCKKLPSLLSTGWFQGQIHAWCPYLKKSNYFQLFCTNI